MASASSPAAPVSSSSRVSLEPRDKHAARLVGRRSKSSNRDFLHGSGRFGRHLGDPKPIDTAQADATIDVMPSPIRHCRNAPAVFQAFISLCCSWHILAAETTEDPLRLDLLVAPITQALDLQLDPALERYTGSALVELQFQVATNEFRFHAKSIELRRATLDGVDLALRTGEADLVTATASKTVPSGRHTLKITFANAFNHSGSGLYKTVYEGRPYLFTDMAGRAAFPCWDEPGFKIPWRLTLTIPASMQAVANMPIAQTKEQGTNRVLEFGRTPPMSSYLVFLGVGPFERTPVEGLLVPGSIVTAPGKSALARTIAHETPAILSALEQYFDIPYPYPKLDQIATPEFAWGGMENAGAISYKDAYVLLDTEHASFEQRRGLIGLITHEMSHMWFGDFVTMNWWDDVWLNESFADWMTPLIAGRLHPEMRFEIGAYQSALRAHEVDAHPSVKQIRRPFRGGDNLNEVFDALSYNKGQAILRMVEGWVGPEKFRLALRRHFMRHSWGNARAEDLWAAFDQEVGGNISEMLRGYIEQPGLPHVTFTRLSGDRCELRRRRYQTILSKGGLAGTWRVPGGIRYGGGGTERKALCLLAKEQDVFTVPGLDNAEWVYPNANESGYYEWSLPADLTAALTAEKHAPLTVVERLGLLHYADSAVASGQLTAVQAMQLQLSLVGDTDPDVQQMVVNSLNNLRSNYLSSEDRPTFARVLHRRLRPMLDALGLEPRLGELPQIGSVRASLLATLGCDGDEPDVIEFCRAQAKRQLSDPRTVDPAIADAALRVAAWNGDGSLVAALRQAFERAHDPDIRSRFMGALSAFRDPNLVRGTLDYSLTEAMNPTEFTSALWAAGRPELASVVFDWFVAHYEPLRKKLREDALPFTTGILNMADASLLAKGRAFFLDPSRKTPLLEVELTKVTEGVEFRLALQERHQEGVRRLVQALGSGS